MIHTGDEHPSSPRKARAASTAIWRARSRAPDPGCSSSARCGASRHEARDGGRLRARRLVRAGAQHVLALGVHRRVPFDRPTWRGSGCRRSTGTTRSTMPALRCSGCAPRRSAPARSPRSASAWAGASRSSRRHASASMPPSGSTRSASPSISTRSATSPLPLQLHYGLNDEHIPKSEIDAVAAAAAGNATSRFSSTPAPSTASSTGPFRPTISKAVEPRPLTSTGFAT